MDEIKVTEKKMEQQGRKKNNFSRANTVSRTFFCWMLPLFYRGMKRELDLNDLSLPTKINLSEKLSDKLERNWFLEEQKATADNKKPSLRKALIRTFFWDFQIHGFILLVGMLIFRNLQPVALKMLLQFFEESNTMTINEAYATGAVLVLLTMGSSLFVRHGLRFGLEFGMRLRIACSSLIYRKVLRMELAALSDTAAGKVVNLLSNDVGRFDMPFAYMPFMWIAPIQVAFAVYLMYQEIGWYAFPGMGVMVLQTVPIQGYLSGITAKFRLTIAQRTDERVKIMSEIVSGIKVIKMYAWEKPFESVVAASRKKEISTVKKTSFIRAFYSSFTIFAERTALYVTLLIYSLMRNSISSSMVFSISSFFNIVRITLAIWLPNAISLLSEALVAVDRIQEFLLLEEWDDLGQLVRSQYTGTRRTSNMDQNKTTNHNGTNGKCSNGNVKDNNRAAMGNANNDTAVSLVHVAASWASNDATLKTPTLSDITMRIKKGQLCAVIGAVGSGKSSLLQLLLSELRPSSGEVEVNGKQSYAAQEPWLFVDTIRQNILFDQPYDPDKYNRVVEACALEADFRQISRGDMALVGERGVSLSGGQRARINLARAVYREADIYLLDDPLSAVDSAVGRQLFENCINGYLKGSTRILVTHQLHYLKSADLIIILNNGAIEKMGTYQELSQLTESYAKLLTPITTDEKEESENNHVRRRSTLTRTLTNNDLKNDKDRNMEEVGETLEEEERGTGGQSSLYAKYIRAGNSWFYFVFVVSFIIFGQVVASSCELWVSYWTNNQSARKPSITIGNYEKFNNSSKGYEMYAKNNIHECTIHAHDHDTRSKANIALTKVRLAMIQKSFVYLAFKFFNNLPMTIRDVEPKIFEYRVKHWLNIEIDLYEDIGPFNTLEYLYVYTALAFACIVIVVLRACFFFHMCMKSSQGLHNKMFHTVLQAVSTFYDRNPSGRILNRFSKDIGQIDELLPRTLMDAIQIYLLQIASMVLVAMSLPWTLATAFVVCFILYLMLKGYLRTAQAVKRIEGVTKSPVFSHVTATLNGMTTIRCSDAQERCIKEFDDIQDVHTSTWIQYTSGVSTFGWWLDFVCSIYIFIVIFAFLLIDTNLPSGYIGLAISQALAIAGLLQFGIRQTTEAIALMTSVERILQYTEIPMEKNLEKGEIEKPNNWPVRGAIDFKSMNLRYDVNKPPVLLNLNINISPGSKIGIVGRTGAGKTSLITALFRLANVEGEIKIDGMDTGAVSLQELRSSISIIPQEPVLFSASVRYNLDPFNKYDDETLWKALETVELKDAVHSLDYKITQGGSNFSVGQRQLICLARAIIKNNKILVLDEATANVDPQTDNFIQQTIRRRFFDCTVLTIAHRLNTIMDSDQVMVMHYGRVVEFDHPHTLLNNPQGYFTKMVAETGAKMSEQLTNVAKDCYELRSKRDIASEENYRTHL